MIQLEFTSEQIETLRYERFHHPHPLVQRRCEALLLKVKGLSTTQIAEILDVVPNTVRTYYYQFLNGGIEAFKTVGYKGKPSKLREHQHTLEEDFRKNPPATVAEARDRIEQLTGIRRGKTDRKSVG